MWTVITPVITAIVAGVAVWWFTQYIGLKVMHRHRIIEEHTKKLQEYTEKYYIKHEAYAKSLQKQFEQIVTTKGTTGAIPLHGIVFNLFTVARRSKLEEEWTKNASAMLLLNDRTGEAVLSELAKEVEEMIVGENGFMTAQDDAKLRLKMEIHENPSEFKGKIYSDTASRHCAKVSG